MRNFLARHRRGLSTFGCIMLCFSALCLVTGCGVPTFLQDIEMIVPVAVSAITGLLALLGSLTGNPAEIAAAAAINAIATKVSAGFDEINNLIAQYKSNPTETLLQKIEDGINEVTADLKNILTIEGLPADLAGKIQTITQIVVSQLESLLSVIPIFKSSTAGASLAVVKPLPAAAFKAQIHAVLAPPAA